MENNSLFTQDEEKIRKSWLLWMIKIPIAILIVTMLTMTIYSFSAFELANTLGIVVIGAIGSGWLYLTYYCAYKTPGTILLLLSLIGIAIELSIEILPALRIILKHSNEILSTSDIFSLIIETLYGLRCYYLSKELRKINQKVKGRRLSNSEEHKQAQPST